MATENLSRCLDEILRHEGGYVDHPSDPGGATNMGITRKTLARWRQVSPWWALPKSEVKALKRSEVLAIYKARYWNTVAGNAMPAGLDLALFDFAVNSGPARAVKTLQRELGTVADGIVGPITLNAVRDRAKQAGSGALIKALCSLRLTFLMRLTTFATFGRGWTKRVENIRSVALKLANAESEGFQTDRRTTLDILSGYKTYIMATMMLFAGVGQLVGMEIPGFDGQSAGHLIMEALAVFFLRKGIKTEIGNA